MTIASCTRYVLCVALLFTASSCARNATVAPANTLRIGIGTEPHTLDPLLIFNGQEMVIDRLFSDTLTSYDPSGNRVVPILASRVPSRENGDISADGRHITFHLRRGVRWQDGAPFTSRDVAFTFHQVMNPANNVVSRIGYDDVARVETPDSYTVRFDLIRPYAPIVTTLFGDANSPYGIIPEHVLNHVRSLEHIPFDTAPIGTGPFRVVSWIHGDRIELDANPNYFLGRPRLRHITILFAHNEQTLLTMMRAHEIDWAAEMSPSAVRDGAAAMNGTRVVLVPQNRWYGLMFNLTNPNLRDPRVRRAVELAIDKRRFAHSLTYDTALAATQDLPDFLWAYPQNLKRSPYDPAQARRLLAQAGWTAGHPLPMEVAFDQTNSTARQTVVVLQSALGSVNITVTPHGYSNEMLTGPAATGGIVAKGNFDVALARILNGPEPDNSAEYRCDAAPPNGFNFARYCSAEMEHWQNVALTSYDRETRKRAYAHIESILERDLPQIPLWWPRDVHLITRRFQGFSPNPFVETWNAYLWRVN